jgi:type I restriction enzyme S subunit
MTQATKTIPKGYKQTEIGVIPVDWDMDNLGNFVTIRSGESPSKFKISKSGVPYFKVDQLNNSVKLQKETPYYIEVSNPIKADSLIFPKRGAAIYQDKIRILAQESYMDTNLMTLTVDSKLDNEYLFYYLLARGLSHIADTTSVPQINNKHIIPFKIIFPKSKPEQTAIATVLADTDALIENLEKLIAKKKAIKQGAMQQLLTGKKRLPGFSEGWEVKEFDDIFIKNPSKKFQIQTTEYSSFGKFQVIDQGKSRSVGYSDNITKVFKCPPIGLIIFGDHTREIKFVNFDFVVGADGTQLLTTKNNYSALFLYNYLLTKKIPNTGYNRHFKYLKDIEFYIPTNLEEQTAIASVLSDMDTEIEKLENKLEKYRQIKTGMMQQLLSGKIRLLRK